MMQGPGDVPLLDYLINLGVALVGAAVRFLRQWQENFAEWNGKRVAIEAVINALQAGFSGLLTFWILASWNVSPFYTAFAVGIMGHMGPEGIALLTEIVKNGLRSRTAPPTKE